MAKKFITSSMVGDRKSSADSVRERQERLGKKKNMELLYKCQQLWDNLQYFREERARCFRYVYGDQWGDYIRYKGETMTEKAYIELKGNIPLKNNVIRRLVNSVLGIYVNSESEPVASARDRDEQKGAEMMTITLQANWQKNKMRILLCNQLEEYLIGALVTSKESFEYYNGNNDVYTTIQNPNYIFFDSTMKDPLFRDMSLIGEIHDIPFNELASSFATNESDYQTLSELYANEKQKRYTANNENTTQKHRSERLTFWGPIDTTLCRVYEVWTKELKRRYRCVDPLKGKLFKIEVEDYAEMVEAVNAQRRQEAEQYGIPDEEVPYIRAQQFYDSYWFYQYLTPCGDILLEGESPYWHMEHPYSISAYPFINGEIHSFVNDFIDQQRYINRLITIDDFVRRTGAKGVTMVPSDCIPDDMSPEEFAEQWSSVDGLIVYKPKPGIPEPKQFYSSSVHLNTAELVQLQLQMMEDISSVHGAVQGKAPYSGTSAALYAQQSQNSTTGLAALLLRFSDFVESIATKKAKMIQQFYTEKRVINVSGKGYAGVKEYDPDKARDLEFDYSIKDSAATPTRRMIANDMLMKFWEAGAITIEMLLENGDFPFADSLLQSIMSAKQSAAENGPVSVGGDAAQQVSQLADPDKMQAAQTMLNSR